VKIRVGPLVTAIAAIVGPNTIVIAAIKLDAPATAKHVSTTFITNPGVTATHATNLAANDASNTAQMGNH
jgi:hypothetical protein